MAMYITSHGGLAPAPPCCIYVAVLPKCNTTCCINVTLWRRVLHICHTHSHASGAYQPCLYCISSSVSEWVRFGPIICIYPPAMQFVHTTYAILWLHELLQCDTIGDKLLTALGGSKRPIQRPIASGYPYPVKRQSAILRFLSNENKDLHDPCNLCIPDISE